jgi:hypothetical protein
MERKKVIEKKQLEIAEKPLSIRQLTAAEALAIGTSQREVCRQQGISRSVLQSWLKKRGFAAQVEEFRQAILAEVRGRLLKLLPDATEALADTIRQSPPNPPSHGERTRAAEVALKAGGALSHGGPAGGGPMSVPQLSVFVVTAEQVEEVKAELREKRERERQVIDISEAQ